MVNRLITKCDCVSVLSTQRRLLFLHRGAGRAAQHLGQGIGELSGHETLIRLKTTIETLTSTIELSGTQIKNAVLVSIFVARRSREPLAMLHLLRGMERELSKEGRSVGTRERERLMRDA